MESPISNNAAKEFQITGVSRSGRVRKKSSKLLDFESPEEIEKRTKRPGRQPARYPGRGRPPNALRSREQELALVYGDDDEDHLHNHNHLSDMDDDAQAIINVAVGAGVANLLNSDDEVDTLVQDLVQGVQAEASSFTNDSRVRQSLYMREKSNNKRKVLKDGKMVPGKMQRKDKGKARYTAYSLWAREVRKREFPDLDVGNASRRLSELWANVSNKDKNAWRRKAKIQATKARTRERNGTADVGQTEPAVLATNGNLAGSAAITDAMDATFVNRATTSRTKKLAAERKQPQEHSVSTQTTWAQSRQKRNSISRIKSIPALSSDMELMNKQPQHSSIETIDAAAHLKLLGESLTIIGERLKEHNGHVALSGSLSVLLDSLLCSMGPLLCMTTQIPGLENKTQLSTNLASTLDNIAYVMPGL